MSTETTQRESLVTLTAHTIEKLKSIVATDPEAKGKSLRVALESGGCSGYQYVFTFDTKKDNDTELSFNGFTVLIDPQSAPFLKDSQIDFSEDATGAGFKIKNPNVKGSCGCGQSNQF